MLAGGSGFTANSRGSISRCSAAMLPGPAVAFATWRKGNKQAVWCSTNQTGQLASAIRGAEVSADVAWQHERSLKFLTSGTCASAGESVCKTAASTSDASACSGSPSWARSFVPSAISSAVAAAESLSWPADLASVLAGVRPPLAGWSSCCNQQADESTRQAATVCGRH